MPPTNSTVQNIPTQQGPSVGHKILHFFLWFFAVIGMVSALIFGFILFKFLPMIGNVALNNANQPQSVRTNSSSSFDQTINSTLLHAALKNYYNHNNGMYPQTLNELVPNYLPNMPTDVGGVPYQYRTTENAKGYELCNMKNGQPRCLGKDSTGNSTGI